MQQSVQRSCIHTAIQSFPTSLAVPEYCQGSPALCVRYSLSDGVLVKDNHIAACGSITEAVRRVRSAIPHTLKIEVECDTLAQVEECLRAEVEIIMLDNMDTTTMAEAVRLIGGRAMIEASGGVSLETVRKIAETGVDIISVGALTHSAPAVDIGLDWF